MEWARQTFDEEELLNQVREIEATGGVRRVPCFRGPSTTCCDC
jgi:hypothetical protein